jgi:hypothetical protein
MPAQINGFLSCLGSSESCLIPTVCPACRNTRWGSGLNLGATLCHLLGRGSGCPADCLHAPECPAVSRSTQQPRQRRSRKTLNSAQVLVPPSATRGFASDQTFTSTVGAASGLFTKNRNASLRLFNPPIRWRPPRSPLNKLKNHGLLPVSQLTLQLAANAREIRRRRAATTNERSTRHPRRQVERWDSEHHDEHIDRQRILCDSHDRRSCLLQEDCRRWRRRLRQDLPSNQL